MNLEQERDSSPALESDRRAHRRAPLDQPVLIEAPAPSEPVRARDVSRGGISIQADMPLEVGRVVEIYFELPIGYAVEAQAEVVRSDSGVLALRFLNLDHEAEVALRSFCRISGLHRVRTH